MEASDVKYWRVQILNTIILIRSPWGWVGEGIGLNAKSTPRQFQKMQNCRLILTWQLRPEPSSGRHPWRWPRSPSWSPAPSGRSSGWLLRQASPAFPWSYSRWKLGSALSSDPGSVWKIEKTLKTRTSPSILVRSPAPESCASDQTTRTGATRNCQSSSPKQD